MLTIKLNIKESISKLMPLATRVIRCCRSFHISFELIFGIVREGMKPIVTNERYSLKQTNICWQIWKKETNGWEISLYKRQMETDNNAENVIDILKAKQCHCYVDKHYQVM